MRLLPRARRPLAALAATVVAATLVQGADAWADARTAPEAQPGAAPTHPSAVEPAKRGELLGKGWEKSTDRAWTTSGDADGFHVLAADAKDGYSWHTVTTLREEGLDADQWIGNACVTGSGKRLVAVYAPRTFANKADLFGRGGFTAVVDLETGRVTKLPVHASLAYYSPGCGTDEQAVLTQTGDENLPGTRLIRVDAATGTVSAPLAVEGQVSSAVPAEDGTVVAADTERLIRIDTNGKRTELAKTDAVPFHLKPDADGGVVFMDHKGNDASVKRLPSADSRKAPQPGRPDILAAGGLDRLGLAAGSHGKVFITGEPGKVAGLPRQVKHVKAPNDATVSTEGRAVIDRTAWADQQSVQLTPATGAEPRPVAIEMSVPDTGKATAFTVTPDAAPASGTASAPASTATAQGVSGAAPRTLSAQAAPAGSPSDPVEEERFCAVPRNDPRNQAMQPKPRQVEWAVDQAVVGNLNTQRPANWKNLGMPAYSPQGLFPSLALNGGGHVPAQIMLGIIAQESNMWQAARYAVPGVTGNPLIGNYYGRPVYNASTADDWDIHWDKADCGYGLTQQTDGMRLPEHTPAGAAPAMAYQTQRAVALDYATNIAAGLRTLQQKWNETTAAGMKLNNGDWSKPENWFYATWAYNSGFHADAGDGSPWGLGWANNPANPNYPANRKPFLNANNYADASHPQDWPYPEKVIGWAAYPIEGLESPGKTVAGFRAAWWNGADGAAANANRYTASPPATLFCDAGNACLPGQSYTPNAPDVVGEPAGPCAHTTGGKYDLKCWYNKPATWKGDCSYSCGNELIRFNTTYPEEADGTAYPPNCTLTGLPAGAMVVDDLPDTVPSVRPNCTRPPNYGTFSLDFARDAAGNYPSKVDFHQLGAGFGGHFSFAHTRTAGAEGGRLAVTGTWKLAVDVNGPAQVLVHLPDHGAQTTEAKYEIDTAKGTKSRTVSQPGTGNRWVPLGVFLFAGKPTVRLSNVTDHGTGDADIAYDAIAVAPVHGTFVERTFDAVANFSSHQNLDTDTPSAITTPMRTRQTLYDWGHARTAGGRNYDGRTLHGLSNYATCQPGGASADCVGAATARAAADWGRDVEAAGTDTIADWLAFANRPAPTVIDPHDSYTDDHSYKIKTHIEVSWVAGDDGKIVPGSEAVVYAPRTGNTEIAPFITAFVKATVADYGSLGITLPDLSFTATDPNVHGTTAKIANPIETGITPGQAYVPGTRPARIDSSGTCLNTKIVSGGSIGYRLLDAQPSTDAAMNTWANELAALADRGSVPREVADTAGDIYSTFFRQAVKNSTGDLSGGSLYNMAPPIWQNISMAFCTDGTVKSTQATANPDNTPALGLAYQSYMPDLFLYLDGRMVDQTGRPSSGPVQHGDFGKFSAIPGVTGTTTAYGTCGIDIKGNGGNPWSIQATPENFPVDRPKTVMFCDDGSHAG